MLENHWSAIGNATSALGPSGWSFGPSSLAPMGIQHLLLSTYHCFTVRIQVGLLARWLCTGSIRLLGPVRGPSRHVLTLQMEVRSVSGVVMSRHIAHVIVHVGPHRF